MNLNINLAFADDFDFGIPPLMCNVVKKNGFSGSAIGTKQTNLIGFDKDVVCVRVGQNAILLPVRAVSRLTVGTSGERMTPESMWKA